MWDAHKEGTLLLPAKQFPMVILINRGSASASEILAAALQDHKRAVIVGERSYGKGSVQNVIMMENDTAALKLTTASYWRPSGKNINRFPDKKEAARAGLIRVGKEMDLGETALWTRVNELASPYVLDDLTQLVRVDAHFHLGTYTAHSEPRRWPLHGLAEFLAELLHPRRQR